MTTMTTFANTSKPTDVFVENVLAPDNASVANFVPVKAGEMSNAVQAENELTAVGKAHCCTEQGMDWMSWSLDPFKDTKRRKSGYPDSVTTKNVVQIVTQSVDVSTTSGGSNWDAVISMSPLATGITMSSFTLDTNGCPNSIDLSTSTPPPVPMGGVEVRQGVAGNPMNTNNISKNLPLPFSYVQHGNIRVIGQAMEIYNTTSQLNLQGAVTVFRGVSPPLDETNGMLLRYPAFSTGVDLIGNSNMYTMPEVPRTLAEADNMPDSKSWKAADGAYQVATMCSDRSPPFDSTLMSVMPLYLDPKGAIGWTPEFQNLPGSTIAFKPDGPPLFGPFNLIGAYFTGLSPETTLRVRARWIIERFPDFNNSDLITLAEEPSPYDPDAIELYARTAMQLPVGVPVSDNDLGTWVKTIADVADFAGVPFAGLISKGITAYNTISNTKSFAPTKPNIPRFNPNIQQRRQYPQQQQPRQQRKQQPRVVEIVENARGPHYERNRRKREKAILRKQALGKQIVIAK